MESRKLVGNNSSNYEIIIIEHLGKKIHFYESAPYFCRDSCSKCNLEMSHMWFSKFIGKNFRVKDGCTGSSINKCDT